MAVTGSWIKKMEASDSITGVHIDWVRWISKAAVADDDLLLTLTHRDGSTSTVSSVADGPRFIDLIWLNMRLDLTVTTMDTGYIEVAIRGG